LRADFDVEVDYRLFFLHPEVPPGGMGIEGLYGGNREYIESVRENYRRMADQAGLPVGKLTIIANTKVPLMVAEIAKEQGLHEPYHRAVYHAYWADGKNIGEWDVLASIIKDVGLELSTEDMVQRFQDLANQVDDSFKHGIQSGVSGIPTFFIGGEKIVGAQPYEIIKQFAEWALNHDGTDKMAST
jgi:predicted DsbA family dithiol-disulfide isomerase